MAMLYIDESGEEGFSSTSSEWFILGGVIHDAKSLPIIISRYDDFKARFKTADWYFHFQRKNHHECLGFINWIIQTPFKAFAVVIHKPSIVKPDNFKRKYWLYFYALRFMLERVTGWASTHAKEPLGIHLSARRGLRKEDLQEYFFRIKNSVFVKDDRIVWDHLAQDHINVTRNQELRGLQVADCVASSIFQALEHSQYGTTEPRYIRDLRPLFERHRYSVRSSIKLWPDLPTAIAKESRLDWYFRE